MPRPKSTPTYRLHRPTGLAVTTIDGKDHYLGPHGTAQSRAEYDRLIATWLAGGRRMPERNHDGVSVAELAAAFWKYATTYYVKNGRPTNEQNMLKAALGPARRLYAELPADEFTPRCLKAVRAEMIRLDWCRNNVNKQVSRVKSVFRWGVEQELVSPSVHQALLAVRGLAKGRTDYHGARESEPVRPVPEAHIEAIRTHVSRQVWGMIQVQLLTGCRPGEAISMRPIDIDTTGKVWMYRPDSHKTEHHGKDRVIALGPQAQEIIRPFLAGRAVDACLFSPAEAEAERHAAMRQKRRTRVQPSQVERARRARERMARGQRRRGAGDRFTTCSYCRAIVRGCEKAGVPAWHPHRLRHSAATRIRAQFGIDVARAVLGHSSATMTGQYAELDTAQAVHAMMKIG